MSVEVLADHAHRDRRRDRRAVVRIPSHRYVRPGNASSRSRKRLQLARRLGRCRIRGAARTLRRSWRRRCAGCGCNRSADCRARGSRTSSCTSGMLRSSSSTKRSARSVSVSEVPFGDSTWIRNCGVSALGNRLEPITGTRTADSSSEPPMAATTVSFRPRQAPVQRGPVVVVDDRHDALEEHGSPGLPSLH